MWKIVIILWDLYRVVSRKIMGIIIIICRNKCNSSSKWISAIFCPLLMGIIRLILWDRVLLWKNRFSNNNKSSIVNNNNNVRSANRCKDRYRIRSKILWRMLKLLKLYRTKWISWINCWNYRGRSIKRI